MAKHTGKVKEYIVGHGDDTIVEITGLRIPQRTPDAPNPDRLYLPNEDTDRKFIHDCILVAIANRLDIFVSYDEESRRINYVRIYP